MISIESFGDFKNTLNFLNVFKKSYRIKSLLEQYGRQGVKELSLNTPIDSGRTASMWNYEIHESHGVYEIVWTNDNINKGVPIAVIIQYGHGTRNGGYVEGIDYINPALKPIFDKIADDLWKEVVDA